MIGGSNLVGRFGEVMAGGVASVSVADGEILYAFLASSSGAARVAGHDVAKGPGVVRRVLVLFRRE